MFQNNERHFYRLLQSGCLTGSSRTMTSADLPSKTDVESFWGSMLSTPEPFAPGGWLRRHEQECNDTIDPQPAVKIDVGILATQLRKLRLWGAPGIDAVQGYWLKKFTFLHSNLAHAFDRILLGTAAIPEWFTNGRNHTDTQVNPTIT